MRRAINKKRQELSASGFLCSAQLRDEVRINHQNDEENQVDEEPR